MFSKILHANDGSEHAFHALTMAVAIARQNNSELYMISVEEIDYMPDFIEEIREETGTAARRYHAAIQRARALADQNGFTLHTHVVAGHPVGDWTLPGRSRRSFWLSEPLGIRRCTSGSSGAALIASCSSRPVRYWS